MSFLLIESLQRHSHQNKLCHLNPSGAVRRLRREFYFARQKFVNGTFVGDFQKATFLLRGQIPSQIDFATDVGLGTLFVDCDFDIGRFQIPFLTIGVHLQRDDRARSQRRF